MFQVSSRQDLYSVSAPLETSTQTVLKALAEDGMRLKDMRAFRANREAVWTAVQQNGLALQYAAPERREEAEIALAAMQQNSTASQYVPPNLFQDLRFVEGYRIIVRDILVRVFDSFTKESSFKKESCEDVIRELLFISGKFKKYRDQQRVVMLPLEGYDVDSVKVISKRLSAKAEPAALCLPEWEAELSLVCSPTISGVGTIDEIAPREIVESLSSQRSLVVYCPWKRQEARSVRQNGFPDNASPIHVTLNAERACQVASFRGAVVVSFLSVEALRGESSASTLIDSGDGGYYCELSVRDASALRPVAVVRTRRNPSEGEDGSRGEASNRKATLAAVKQDGGALRNASAVLRRDREVVLAAVRSDGMAFRYADASLRGDQEIALEAALQYPQVLKYCPPTLRAQLLGEVLERRRLVNRCAHGLLGCNWDPEDKKQFIRQLFAESGMLKKGAGDGTLLPLRGYALERIDLIDLPPLSVTASAFLNVAECQKKLQAFESDEKKAVRSIFDSFAKVHEGGKRILVYHGCQPDAARGISAKGFVRGALRDSGYFGCGIYVTPNAEYACWYGEHQLYAVPTKDPLFPIVLCYASVGGVYPVTREADYDPTTPNAHSNLYGQAVKEEEAHFALVSRPDFEARTPDDAEYCELCISQTAALTPVAVLWVRVEAADQPFLPAVSPTINPRLVMPTAPKKAFPVSFAFRPQSVAAELLPSKVAMAVRRSGPPLVSATSERQSEAPHKPLVRPATVEAAVVVDPRIVPLSSQVAPPSRTPDQDCNTLLGFARGDRDNSRTLNALEALTEVDLGNHDLMLAFVEADGLTLEYASPELRSDREFVLAAVKENGLALQYAHTISKLREDRELVLAAVQQNGLALIYAANELQKDREIVLAAAKQNTLALKYAPVELRRDRDFMLAAVKQNELALEHASPELRRNRDYMLAVVQQQSLALKYASDELQKERGDRDFMLAAAKESELALEHASPELLQNHDFMLAAVQQNGLALKYASSEQRSDRELVHAAVKQNGSAFKFASFNLRGDPKLAFAAVEQSGLALKYANDALRSDRELVLAAVKQNGTVLEYTSEELRQDREIVLAAAKQNTLALKYAPNELRRDRDFMLAAVKQNELALEHASPELQQNRDFMLAAVQQNGLALMYAADELRRDSEIVLAAAKQNTLALEHASMELQWNRDFMLAAVKQNGVALQYASHELRSDREVVTAAVKQNGVALQYASHELRSDREVVTAAVKQNGVALQYASHELRSDREVVTAAAKQNGGGASVRITRTTIGP